MHFQNPSFESILIKISIDLQKKDKYKHPLVEIPLSIPFDRHPMVEVLNEENTKPSNSNSRF
jgi:hypothetical protein